MLIIHTHDTDENFSSSSWSIYRATLLVRLDGYVVFVSSLDTDGVVTRTGELSERRSRSSFTELDYPEYALSRLRMTGDLGLQLGKYLGSQLRYSI